MYTSGRKPENSIEDGYDMVQEYKGDQTQPTQTYYELNNLQTLDLDSNYDDKQVTDPSTNIDENTPVDQSTDEDEWARLNKLPEEESDLDIEDSINDVSRYSIDSFTNSARKIRRESGTEDNYGPVGATKGK